MPGCGGRQEGKREKVPGRENMCQSPKAGTSLADSTDCKKERPRWGQSTAAKETAPASPQRQRQHVGEIWTHQNSEELSSAELLQRGD
jgi:hypothetical protein